MIKTISDLREYDKIISQETAALVYFSHDQCNVCKVLKPKVKNLLTTKFEEIKMFYVDIKNTPEISAQNSIFTVPTLLIYFNSKEHSRKSRNISILELQDILDKPYQLLFAD